jgi:hypothetical protein
VSSSRLALDDPRSLVGRRCEWEKAARGRPSSDFRPYPGFVAFPYSEYSEPFFGDGFKVLRGGSWATMPRVARNSFRNWDSRLQGTLRTPDEKPIVIGGLWALDFGNGGRAGPPTAQQKERLVRRGSRPGQTVGGVGYAADSHPSIAWSNIEYPRRQTSGRVRR